MRTLLKPVANMPAIEPPQSIELSDAELDQLDGILRTRATPHGGLSLEALDGFLSALIVGPELVMPSEYLPFVWGEDAPDWESQEQAETALTLVMKLWNQIARRVRLDPESAEDAAFPLLALPDDMPEEESPELDDYDYPIGADWAAGFLLGASLRADRWDERMEQSEELAQDFEDLQSLLLEEDEEDETGEGMLASDLSFKERMAILGEVPFLLNDMQQWRAQEQPQTPVRREDKPDRNEPCPCGSGKKFKKCHGDPSRLH
jgi:uncharacterized protein